MGADGGHGMQLALIVAVDRTGVAPGTDHCGFTRPQALDRPVGAVTESVQTVLHEELSGVPLSLQVRRPRAEGRADAAGGVETASGLLLAADEGAVIVPARTPPVMPHPAKPVATYACTPGCVAYNRHGLYLLPSSLH